MAQIRNRFEIKNSILDEELTGRKLPRFFQEHDDIRPAQGLLMSCGVHVILIILFIALGLIQKTIFPHIPKPQMKQDIEFKLVQDESKPPINKKTKIRADRDSRAGGKHDPKRAISMPSPKPSPKSKKVAGTQSKQKQTQKVAQKPAPKMNNIFKQLTQPKKVVSQAPTPTKQVVKQLNTQPSAPTVKKPAPIKAPGASVPNIKPSVKPTAAAPSKPKIATAPTSPFKVNVPKSSAPVGTTYRAQTSGTGASSYSGGSSSGGNGVSPKFSTQKGSGSGSASGSYSGSSRGTGSSYASRGSSGSAGGGSYGNPSPGNPKGAPGIDAIRQPNWGPYMRDLEQKIKRNWSPPKGDTSKRVVITFTIARDGRLLSHRVTKSSGVPLADRAAMSAIELTAPFRPLPPEFKGQSVPIEFTFDYNVLNSVLK